MADGADLESLARRLEQDDRYRVLRRLEPMARAPVPLPPGARTGVVLDVETTGLDHGSDVVIELAMVRFAYSSADEVLGVVDTFQSFSDPGRPLDPEITAITGITDDMVRGQVLDLEAVRSFVGTSALVVAHNAAFDRPFAEALCSEFAERPWACCMSEPPWGEEGYEGRSLALLALQAGFFYGRHRALNDCMAALELLARPLPRSGLRGLAARRGRPARRMRGDTFRVASLGKRFAPASWPVSRSRPDVQDDLSVQHYRRRGITLVCNGDLDPVAARPRVVSECERWRLL